jgi:hypothetical protein
MNKGWGTYQSLTLSSNFTKVIMRWIIKDIFLCLVMWKCKFNKSIINETITNITTQFQLMEIIMLSTNMGNNKITEHKGSGLKGKA